MDKLEIENLKTIARRILYYALIDLKYKIPVGMYVCSQITINQMKKETLDFVFSEYCEALCELAGIDYNVYKRAIMKVSKNAFGEHVSVFLKDKESAEDDKISSLCLQSDRSAPLQL